MNSWSSKCPKVWCLPVPSETALFLRKTPCKSDSIGWVQSSRMPCPPSCWDLLEKSKICRWTGKRTHSCEALFSPRQRLATAWRPNRPTNHRCPFRWTPLGPPEPFWTWVACRLWKSRLIVAAWHCPTLMSQWLPTNCRLTMLSRPWSCPRWPRCWSQHL